MKYYEQKTPLFSVVIPAFNSETSLEACVSSVLQSDVQNHAEIIIVDDCSRDNTEKICNTLSARFEKVHFFRNDTNQGVGLTRNIGLSKCKGKYISFLDSDDYFESFQFDKASISDLCENDYDLAFLSIRNDSRETSFYELLIDGDDLELDGKSIIENNIIKENFPSESFGYLFNKDFLKRNKINFPNMRIGEDMVFMTSVFLNIVNVIYISEVKYIHSAKVGGLATTFSPENINHYSRSIDILQQLHRYYSEDSVERLYLKMVAKKLFEPFSYYLLISYHDKYALDYRKINANILWILKIMMDGSASADPPLSDPCNKFIEKLVNNILYRLQDCIVSYDVKNFVYCLSGYSASVLSVLNSAGIKVEAIIDDNRFGDPSYLNKDTPVQSFDESLLSKDFSLSQECVYQFFVCHPSSMIFQKIKRKLTKFGFDESSVFWIHFNPVDILMAINE